MDVHKGTDGGTGATPLTAVLAAPHGDCFREKNRKPVANRESRSKVMEGNFFETEGEFDS
jgi:hypothetical protein